MMSDESTLQLYSILEKLKTKNSYEVEKECTKFIKGIEHQLVCTDIKKLDQDTFFRARIGHNEESASIDDLDIRATFPYIRDEISAPPPLLATSGRFNRLGCSFLYLASDEHTAIAEIKPEVGHICSIGKFEYIGVGKYLDFRREKTSEENMNEELNEFILELFTEPITSSTKYRYLITQFLSDVFRKLDYNGMIYSSAQSKTGFNITSYYPKDFKFIDYSDKMLRVEGISYSFSKQDENYKKYKDYEKLFYFYSTEDTRAEEKYYDYIQDKIIREKS